MKLKLFLLLFTAQVFSHFAFAMDVVQTNGTVPPQLHEYYFTQMINHADSTAGSFKHRYWIDSEFASGPDAPVFLRICGEDTGEYFIPDISMTLAKQFHGYVIYLEHRYYGKSQPYSDISAQHLQYLNLDNIIEDLVSFEGGIKKQMGLTGKWISLGGSYSGTISAIFRLKHPELVAGALAASAPMKQKDFAESDDESGLSSTSIAEYPEGDRQWAYQSCRDFNFWMADWSQTIYRPSTRMCSDLFNITTPVDTAQYTQNYYNPFVQSGANSPSNILFTSGSADVWTQLTISAQDNQNPKITTLLIEGAGHHFDLNAPAGGDSSEVLAARTAFANLVKTWLQN